MSEGMDTIIGTKGVCLLGGEKQRIALAKTILKDASILILDNTTAYADPENKYIIQKALNL
ncbi:ATP-binding cassette domain-containing protein [Clostridium cochlearium]|uniref:ATP-binding cassette domain-containing protein n=2 Tax=Clostridium cochlearium TaxID=1494 RepID=A0A7Y4DEY0_CLOCO|nr:ATP-binding cassette domain-containing protein [Clostridium cochlearium]NOH17280.1 ATP-binding cassette domain-containing protein [Clostridium cochlearium]